MVKDFENNKAVIMTRTVTSWRDTVASSWHNCSTSQELIARITSFLFWFLRFRGQIFRKNQSLIVTCTVTSWRNTVTSSWHCSTSRELIARITWFLCWILRFRGQGSRKKQSRHRGVYRDVMTGHTNIITSLFKVTVSRHEVTVHRDDDGFVFFEILDPENIGFNTKTT